MWFEISEEAAALREAAASVLATTALAEARQASGAPGAGRLDGSGWRKLAAAGALGVLVPEDRGGLGLDENCLAPLLTEIGYSGLPGPVAETIAVAAPLLPDHAGVLSGDVLVTALLDDGDLVPHGRQASLLVLRGTDGLRLFPAGEVRLAPVAAVDQSRAVARLRRPVSGGLLLTDDPSVIERAWLRGVLGTAALLTGLARRMLDMTVDYVRHREQYGVPVGSFQAVKHALADALVAVEFAEPMVLAAAWHLSVASGDAVPLTRAAKAQASDAARQVARTAIQCHGAMGYTTEYDLHLFAKRAWALASSFGSPREHRSAIARLMGV